MAISTPFIIAILSLLVGVDSVINQFVLSGRSFFWPRLAFAACGILLSLLPVIIGISVFIRTKGSRVKALQKAFLSFLIGDMYNEVNYRLWIMNRSVYCNILNEQTEFYRDDYRAILKPSEAESVQKASNHREDLYLKVEFGFEKCDSALGKRAGFTAAENKQDADSRTRRYNDYFTERVSIQLTEGRIFILGTLVVKDKLCQYPKGCTFVRGDHKLDNKGMLKKEDHMLVRYNKTFEKTGLGPELKLEVDYDPWSHKISLTMKCGSFPRGITQTMKGKSDDYINLLKLVEYYDIEAGWIMLMKDGNIRTKSRGASIFHGTHFFRMVEMMRDGFDLYEVNIDTHGEPCLVEGG